MGAHVSKLGRSLDGAVKSYNETVGSLERQVLPQARRFEQHGITGIEPPELVPIDRQTRALSAQELIGDTRRRRRSRSRSARPTPALPRLAVRRERGWAALSAVASVVSGESFSLSPGFTARRPGTRSTPDSFTTVEAKINLEERLKPLPLFPLGAKTTVSDVRNVIIIGGGPAGYTAALYSARANLHPLVIEGFNWGGQLMITSDVENYPGYADGVMGPVMMQDFRRQAERFGAEFLTDDVTRVDFSERPFKVYVGNDEYRADSVIVATGASARQLGLESELRLQGRGVSYCATCDASFFRDKVVTVVGGGDSALEEATFISRFASKVYLVHRREEFRASPIMVDRARTTENIEFVLNKAVDEVLGDGKVSSVRLRDTVTGELSEIETDGFFVAIGHDPNTGLFLDQLDHEEDSGYLITKGKSTETNVAGVFAAGDVQDHTYRQAVTAAGSGCAAALDAERFLSEQRHAALAAAGS